MKKNILIIILCLSFIISGCASTAAEITPKYITPHTYQNLDCNQISTEMLRVSNQVTELTGQQNKIHKNDQMMGWVGSFFLWPLYLLIKGDGTVASELASAKGNYEALSQSYMLQKCGQ